VFGLSEGAPTGLPLTVAEVKSRIRVDHDAEDADIQGMIAAAAQATEKESRRVWLTRTFTLTLADWPECGGPIELPTEAAALTSVKYYAADGTLTTLAGCQSWLTHRPPLVYPPINTSWPGLQSGKVAPVVVTYTAGTAASGVPDAAKEAMLLCVADSYENRGDGKSPHERGVPERAASLCQLLRTGDYP
jgi:uncharacterized phiE125 gp8 family phage protein